MGTYKQKQLQINSSDMRILFSLTLLMVLSAIFANNLNPTQHSRKKVLSKFFNIKNNASTNFRNPFVTNNHGATTIHQPSWSNTKTDPRTTNKPTEKFTNSTTSAVNSGQLVNLPFTHPFNTTKVNTDHADFQETPLEQPIEAVSSNTNYEDVKPTTFKPVNFEEEMSGTDLSDTNNEEFEENDEDVNATAVEPVYYEEKKSDDDLSNTNTEDFKATTFKDNDVEVCDEDFKEVNSAADNEDFENNLVPLSDSHNDDFDNEDYSVEDHKNFYEHYSQGHHTDNQDSEHDSDGLC